MGPSQARGACFVESRLDDQRVCFPAHLTLKEMAHVPLLSRLALERQREPVVSLEARLLNLLRDSRVLETHDRHEHVLFQVPPHRADPQPVEIRVARLVVEGVQQDVAAEGCLRYDVAAPSSWSLNAIMRTPPTATRLIPITAASVLVH